MLDQRGSVASPAGRAATRIDAAARAVVGRPLVWLVVIALVAAWPVVWTLRTRVPPSPPVLGALPAFRLTDQHGRPFGSQELAGRVWVASFIFTRCETVCPAVTRKMARIQDRTRNLEPALHLVSFSVDPEHDTPERLAERAHGATHHQADHGQRADGAQHHRRETAMRRCVQGMACHLWLRQQAQLFQL
jgi:cytochrome oxidase Cu insertion factor (SCO1/SenC/PrrC family)